MLPRFVSVTAALLITVPALASEPSVCETPSPTSDAARLTVDVSSTEHAPDGIVLMGAQEHLLLDDGAGADQVEGDGVYSVAGIEGDAFGDIGSEHTDTECAPLGVVWGLDFEIICDIEFLWPGDTCEGTGEVCEPESMLGSDTIFCICIYDCEVSVGGSVGSD